MEINSRCGPSPGIGLITSPPVAPSTRIFLPISTINRLGQPIGANDLLIGCHALHRQRVLVTQNLREFERLQGLSVEDWSGSSSGA